MRLGDPASEARSEPKANVGADGARPNIGFVFHGYAITHLDSLAHYFWDGRMYGGRPAALVTRQDGAKRNAVTAASGGIVTRGVLLDIAQLRGVDWLEPGEGVFPEELEAAEIRAGVRAGVGDALLLRTGYGRKKRVRGPDRAQDVQPCGYPSFRSPVHAIGIVAMELWLLDPAISSRSRKPVDGSGARSSCWR